MADRETEELCRTSQERLSDSASIASQTQGSDVSLPSWPADDVAQDMGHSNLLPSGDINSAAALRAQYAIDIPRQPRRRRKKAAPHDQHAASTNATITTENNNDNIDESREPLVDNTAILPLHSKRTIRLQRKQEKRSAQLAAQLSATTTLLSLPSELWTEIFSQLAPNDIHALSLTSHLIHNFISAHESSIARSIIQRRYWTLYRCFPLPVPIDSVPQDAHAALLSPKRQELLNLHRKSYTLHVQPIDSHEFCTCMTCVFAWNNLCLIIDLHHWQPHLENRDPLPIIPRGTNPPWNQTLLSRNASLVRSAISRPLLHAHILQMHLDTITSTIRRNARWRRKIPTTTTPAGGGGIPIGAATALAAHVAMSPSSSTTSKPNLYRLTDQDVARGTDEFLDRAGPPSYDFPFMRDNYYSLEAYLPNRKWSKNESYTADGGRWHYYPAGQHERDLEWVRNWAVGALSKG